MHTRRTWRVVVWLALGMLPFGITSCVITGWPPLPPTTYHGRVVDSHGRPVAGAQVTLYRPDKSLKTPLNGWLEDTDEEMARTHTNRDGRFVVTTRSGYATFAYADAPADEGAGGRSRMTGRMDGGSNSKRKPLPRDLPFKLE